MARALVLVGAQSAMEQRLISYVRPLRRRWGLTQSEVAFLIGTRAAATVSRIEAVKIYPPLVQAIACSILFDTPTIELFPELHSKAHEFVLRQAADLYDRLQGNASRATGAKLDFLEEVLARPHPLIRDVPSI